MVIISTSAVDVSIQAVSPVLIGDTERSSRGGWSRLGSGF